MIPFCDLPERLVLPFRAWWQRSDGRINSSAGAPFWPADPACVLCPWPHHGSPSPALRAYLHRIGLRADRATLILQRIGLFVPRFSHGTVHVICSFACGFGWSVSVVSYACGIGCGLVLSGADFFVRTVACSEPERQRHSGNNGRSGHAVSQPSKVGRR